MDKNRLEAFSDGVIAIIITIMVLDLKVPHDPTLDTYLQAYPVFVSYALSFLFVGLYWSSHHHLFHKATGVDNRILWVNMLNLFWLSLIPFSTASMGENHFKSITVTIYALNLTLVVATYVLLVNQLCRLHGAKSEFSSTFEGHFKSYFTLVMNITAAIVAAVGFPGLAFVLLVLTSLSWFIPNHRFENK
jgi:uncharacterized membrane protein